MAGKTKEQKIAEAAAEAERLATLATDAFGDKLVKRLTGLGGEWKAIQKRSTSIRLKAGSLARSMMTALVTADYPEADRESAIVRAMDNAGIAGFSYKTIDSWARGSHAYNILAGVKVPDEDGTPDAVVLRDELPLYTLIDLGRIPSDPEHKTGGLVKVATDAWTAGNRTDDELRGFIRDVRNADKTPKDPPTPLQLAEGIAKACKVTPPVLVPNEDESYTLSLADLIAVGMYGVALRSTGGDKDPRAYRMVLDSSFAPKATAEETAAADAADAVLAETA